MCVLSALALAVRPRMDVKEAARICLLNRRFKKKQQEIHYWLNPRGASAQSPLIGWRTANGDARYPAVALKSERQEKELHKNSSIA